MFRTTLVPLDGSELAERVLPFAAALARAGNGGLILLQVGSGAGRAGQPSSRLLAVAELDAVADELRASGIGVEECVYPAPLEEAAQVICRAARERGADLIAMSTHGRGGLGRWLYGSVAEQVLHQAEVPVLLISATCERSWPTDRPMRILVPLDGSPFAEAALGPAGELAAPLGAGLILLQVVESLAPESDESCRFVRVEPGVEGETGGRIEAPSAPDEVEARRYLERIAGGLRAAGRTVDVRVGRGDPTASIAAAADEPGTDLIALATHGRGGIARLVLGSVADGIVRRATLPLLLVRPAAGGEIDAGPTGEGADPPAGGGRSPPRFRDI